jgi:2-oxo-4-hydroxy-4-carboxy-5-ureidoimidazoline decarboxylase
VEQGYDRETAGSAARPAAGSAGSAAHPAAHPADGAVDAERDRVARELARLNDAYEARFGFRYCVFVAGRPRAALLPAMEVALEADRRTELHRALDAVIDIAVDRFRVLGGG